MCEILPPPWLKSCVRTCYPPCCILSIFQPSSYISSRTLFFVSFSTNISLYPPQHYPCILPILSNIIIVFSLSFPISVLYSPYPFQYQSCILPILSNISLVSSLSFQYHTCILPTLSNIIHSHPCMFPIISNIILVSSLIHQSFHIHYIFKYITYTNLYIIIRPCLPILSNIILVSSLYI